MRELKRNQALFRELQIEFNKSIDEKKKVGEELMASSQLIAMQSARKELNE